jgi:hypothetical protein
MTAPENEGVKDLLDQAIMAMRHAPIPDGPRQEITASTADKVLRFASASPEVRQVYGRLTSGENGTNQAAPASVAKQPQRSSEESPKEKRPMTLVIHAPKEKVVTEQKRSFQRTLATGIGDEYAIYADLYPQICVGCRVVVLSKDERRRAEGTLVKLVPTCKTKNGIQRYDVYIKDLKEVNYKSERLNRCGVAVI